MVSKLGKPMKALLLYTSNSDVLPQVEPYFASLANASKNFIYRTLDVALDPALAKEHKVRGNGQVLLLLGESKFGFTNVK